ncbi:MAG: hypothetical protein IJW93_06935 [Clostridia bacterium]|nr:hypothetical protein [Clostridia bacterium]
MSRYVAMQPLVPGRRVDVLEKNAQGHTVGAWYGWWNYKTGRVALYPNVRNRYVNWPGGVKPTEKKFIDDTEIAVRRSDGTTSWFRSRSGTSSTAGGPPSPTVKAKDETPKGETWRDRKLPMQGQERMEI